ncbi:hypothetical protein [Tumidithrix helvetica]|uniref:hypothetical protein n=1 Tax=Tumidithrix helvetica TaxID=3457545 RepID=UPI003CC54BBF
MAADLTFANLNTALGGSVLSATGAVLSIDCSLLMGETGIALTDAKVSEFMTRVLDACATAQVAYNLANPTAQLAGFPPSNGGVPELDPTDGKYYITTRQEMLSRAPINKNETTGVLA